MIVKLQEWASPLGSRGIAQCQTSTAYINQVPIYMATVDPSKHSDTAIRLSTYDDHMIRKHYLRTSGLHGRAALRLRATPSWRRRERGREKGQKREDEGAARWCFCVGGGADKRPCLRAVRGEDRRRARHRARH